MQLKTLAKLLWIPAILLFAACSGPLSPVSPKAGTPASAETGSISIQIPAVAPWLAERLKAVEGRAFLNVGKATIEVQEEQSDGGWATIVGPQDLTPSGSDVLQATIDEVPAGIFRVKVSIYSSVDDAAPAVVGVSERVRVIGGEESWTRVVCIPQVKPENHLDVRSTSGTQTFTSSVAVDGEDWYSLTLKPKTLYEVTWNSDDGVEAFYFDPDGRSWGVALPGSQMTLDISDGRPIYAGVSGKHGANVGAFSYTVTELPGSLVEGSLRFPADARDHEYALQLLNSEGDSVWTRSGRVDDSLSASYYVPGLAAGSYTLVGKLQTHAVWNDGPWSPAQPGDRVIVDQTVVVDGIQPVTLAEVAAESWTLVAGGPSSIEFTATLPGKVDNKYYQIIVDSDLNGGNGVAAVSWGQFGGDNLYGRVDGVPKGQYYVYLLVTNEAQAQPMAGDFVAIYGATSMETLPEAPNFTVGEATTEVCELEAFVYDGSGSGGGSGMLNESGTLVTADTLELMLGRETLRTAMQAMGDGLGEWQVVGLPTEAPPELNKPYELLLTANNGVAYSDGWISYTMAESPESWSGSLGFSMGFSGYLVGNGDTEVEGTIHVYAEFPNGEVGAAYHLTGDLVFTGEISGTVILNDSNLTGLGGDGHLECELTIDGVPYTYAFDIPAHQSEPEPNAN